MKKIIRAKVPYVIKAKRLGYPNTPTMYVTYKGTLTIDRYKAAFYMSEKEASGKNGNNLTYILSTVERNYEPDVIELSIVPIYDLYNTERVQFVNTSGDNEDLESFLENGLLDFDTIDLDDLNKNARTFLACMNVRRPEDYVDLSTSRIPAFRQAFTMAVVMANKIEFGEW